MRRRRQARKRSRARRRVTYCAAAGSAYSTTNSGLGGVASFKPRRSSYERTGVRVVRVVCAVLSARTRSAGRARGYLSARAARTARPRAARRECRVPARARRRRTSAKRRRTGSARSCSAWSSLARSNRAREKPSAHASRTKSTAAAATAAANRPRRAAN